MLKVFASAFLLICVSFCATTWTLIATLMTRCFSIFKTIMTHGEISFHRNKKPQSERFSSSFCMRRMVGFAKKLRRLYRIGSDESVCQHLTYDSFPPLPNPHLPGQHLRRVAHRQRAEAAKRIRYELSGKYTKEQLNASALTLS